MDRENMGQLLQILGGILAMTAIMLLGIFLFGNVEGRLHLLGGMGCTAASIAASRISRKMRK